MKIHRIFYQRDGFGTADARRRFEASAGAVVSGSEGQLEDANRDYAIADRAEGVDLRGHGKLEIDIGREFTQTADADAVPVELIDVVNGGDEQGDIGRNSGSRSDADVAAVP